MVASVADVNPVLQLRSVPGPAVGPHPAMRFDRLSAQDRPNMTDLFLGPLDEGDPQRTVVRPRSNSQRRQLLVLAPFFSHHVPPQLNLIAPPVALSSGTGRTQSNRFS